jgi:hypothetical protein
LKKMDLSNLSICCSARNAGKTTFVNKAVSAGCCSRRLLIFNGRSLVRILSLGTYTLHCCCLLLNIHCYVPIINLIKINASKDYCRGTVSLIP